MGVLKGGEAIEIGEGGGGLRDKAQYFAIDKRVKLKKGREPGMQGTGSGFFFYPLPPPPPPAHNDSRRVLVVYI